VRDPAMRRYSPEGGPVHHGPTGSFSHKVLVAATALLNRYPLATLADIYKSFFQDEFGPGHLLDDHAAALTFLDREIETTVNRFRYEPEPCGLGRCYCRLSLDLVVGGIVSRQRFAEAFLRGSAGFTEPEGETWSRRWTDMRMALLPLRPRIEEFDEAAERIDDRLQHGQYAMHHSARFREAYDPRYRIVRMEDAKVLVGSHG